MKPTFIGIGPPRCGTTSVYHYLKQHPQVHMSPKKETDFFAYQVGHDDFAADRAVLFDPVTSWEEYERLFEAPSTARAAGEISPRYFWWPGVADSVHQALPEARIFCILRNPIDRAYSSYRSHMGLEDEARSFEAAVRTELAASTPYPLRATNWYVRIGLYAASLARWLGLYGPQQVRIFFYEDLEASAGRFMQALFDFIGVDPQVPVDTSTRFNTLGTIRLERRAQPPMLRSVRTKVRDLLPGWLYRLLYRAYSTSMALATPSSPMSHEARHLLQEAYADDIRQLQALTGRDLSHWLNG